MLRKVRQIAGESPGGPAAQPLSGTDVDRGQNLSLGKDRARLWNAATTTAAERKQILRLLLKEVVLDQRRERGQVCIRIVWQTGATSEHRIQRRVQAYADYADLEPLQSRTPPPNAAQTTERQIQTPPNAKRLL